MDLPNLTSLLSSPTTILLALVTLFCLLTHLSQQKHHPYEPPILLPDIPIPYIGHLISMALRGGHYLKRLGQSHPNVPIFTLVVPFSRLYIVTDPSLAVAIQRRPARQLSFNALLPDVVQRVIGLDAATRTIVSKGLDPERGEEKGFLAELHDMLVSFLGPGQELEELTVGAVRELGAELDGAALRSRGEGVDEELLPWVRHIVAQATARLLYGPRNPLALQHHPEQQALENAFWHFDHGLGRLLMGVFPSVTAPRAYRGREKLVAAFRTYIERRHYEHAGEGGDAGASQIVLNRIRIARSHGFSVDGIARSEVSFLFAGIVNTATTTFWTLLRIFADRELLAAIREELGGTATASATENHHHRVPTLSLSALPRDCPTLRAVYREILRLGSNQFSTRLVREDMTLTAAGLEGECFLRKGGVVQIAGGAMHADTNIWGQDAGAFNPGRFLNGDDAKGKDDSGAAAGKQGKDGGPAIHPAAFRAFGGGKTMCPGRHFATGEILGLVASIAMRFEIQGVDGREIQVPEYDDYILPVHILEPVAGTPVRVRIRVRQGDDAGRVDVVP